MSVVAGGDKGISELDTRARTSTLELPAYLDSGSTMRHLRQLTMLAVMLLAAAALSGPTGTGGHGGVFTPSTSASLCAFGGETLSVPCVNEGLSPGENADLTIRMNFPANQLTPSTIVGFLPQGSFIPGPETNALCYDSIDNDADGSVNDGCPPEGYDLESDQCDDKYDDDYYDDPDIVNDGCPAVGPPESSCVDTVDNDGDGRVNDGCFPGGVGSVTPELSSWCTNSENEDPRDDLAGGGLKVNDGCPAVGDPESGVDCEDDLDDDGDGFVNDGCYPGGFGGIEAEALECDDVTDDDGDGYVNDGCPGVGDLPLGAVVGRAVLPQAGFSILNNPCNLHLSLRYPLMNASTNNHLYNLLGSYYGGYEGPLYYFRDDGYPMDGLPNHVNRYPEFLNDLLDPDLVGDINGDGDYFDTVDGVAENPGASYADWYGSIEPIRPLARYSGSAEITSQASLFQLVVLEPGSLASFSPPHTLSDLSAPSLGYPVLVVIDEPTYRLVAPSLVTETCTPIDSSILLLGKTRDNPCTGGACPNDDAPGGSNRCINLDIGGSCLRVVDSGIGPCAPPDESGCVRYTNPVMPGTHYLGWFQQSHRDLDGDGVENPLDSCPYEVNIENARVTGGPDGDMLDSACDLGPTEGDFNQDGDEIVAGGIEWSNQVDNCPTVPNNDQAEAERWQTHAVASPRGGWRPDAMGDACDSGETACGSSLDDDSDGLVNDGCPIVGVVAGETLSQCDNQFDDDFDGLANDGCPQAGSIVESGDQCLNALNDDNADDLRVNDGCAGAGGREAGCLNRTDDDADGYVNDGCPSSARVANGHFHTVWKIIAKCIGGTDADGDGFCNVASTDPLDDPDDNNASKTPEHYALFRAFSVAHAGSGANPPVREPLQVCNDGIDNDGDTLIDLLDTDGPDAGTAWDCSPAGVTLNPTDTDGDGYGDEAEIHIGTDPLSRCAVGGVPAPSGGWPADVVGSPLSADRANIEDVGSYVAPVRRLNSRPGVAGFDRRWDVVPGTPFGTDWINTSDLAAFISGAGGFPPMFGGARAYSGPRCSSHPVYGD